MQAVIYAATGKPKLAEAKILQAQKGKDFVHFHHTEYNIASAYALMRKPKPAIQWLQMAAAEGFPCYPLYAKDPNLASLRDDAHFIEFLDKQRQQWESFRNAVDEFGRSQ